MPRVTSLQRRLGVHDAVVIGVGSMIGAGIFVALTPAAAAAGSWLAAGLAGCVVLAVALPPASVLSGVAVLAVGAVIYAVRRSPCKRRRNGV